MTSSNNKILLSLSLSQLMRFCYFVQFNKLKINPDHKSSLIKHPGTQHTSQVELRRAAEVSQVSQSGRWLSFLLKTIGF